MNKEDIMIKVGELFETHDKIGEFAQAFEKTGNLCVAVPLFEIQQDLDNKLSELSILLDFD